MSQAKSERRELSSTKERLGIAFVSGVLFIPAWAFLFAIFGGFIAYQVGSWGLFWVIFLICPIIAHGYFENRRFKQYEALYHQLADKALESLEKVDYYEAGWANSIALDVSDRKFAVCKPVSLKAPPKVTELPLDVISSATAFTPGKETFFLVGRSSAAAQTDVLKRNIDSHDKSSKATGLYLDCDDLVLNKLFVQMSYVSAERWVKAIEKLKAGTLKPNAEPVDMHSIGQS